MVGNRRIDAALETVWAYGGTPSRVLEVGCGVGSACWRMAEHFPQAEIVGTDFSQGNLAIAERVFARPRVSFALLRVDESFAFGEFDLMILMDVYEHVQPTERDALHRNIQQALSPDGRLILTVPTPRHLAWLRANNPSEIQPVDEDISVVVLDGLASSIGRTIMAYREVDVWRRGDYAHCVIGRSGFPEPMPAPANEGVIGRLRSRLQARSRARLVKRAGLLL